MIPTFATLSLLLIIMRRPLIMTPPHSKKIFAVKTFLKEDSHYMAPFNKLYRVGHLVQFDYPVLAFIYNKKLVLHEFS